MCTTLLFVSNRRQSGSYPDRQFYLSVHPFISVIKRNERGYMVKISLSRGENSVQLQFNSFAEIIFIIASKPGVVFRYRVNFGNVLKDVDGVLYWSIM